MSNFTYSDELCHFGIQGMKWGIRRFQNEDGTRTEAGKKRYAKLNKKIDKEYNKTTKRARKIVANEKLKYSDKKIKKAQLFIDAKTKLRDLQREEVEAGYDYFENKLNREAFVGQLVAGLPGNIISTGLTLLENKDAFDKRMAIDKEYREGLKSLKESEKKAKVQKRLDEQKEFYENRLYGKGEDVEELAKSGLGYKGFTSEQKEYYKSLGENEGRYNIDFLEAIQNSEILYKDDTKAINKEYEKFLEDPNKYWDEDSRKLKQM
jgi:hypothetical protein